MTTDREMIKQLKTSSIYEIVEMIRDTQGTNAKIELLKNAIEHRRGFKEYLKAVYDPFTQYHIRNIPDYVPDSKVFTDIEHMLARPDKFLGMLSERRRTGEEARKFLVYMLQSVPATDAKALELLINRSIDAGVSEKSINKACPGLIAEYPCMLASAFKQKLVDDLDFPAYVQVKMDGLRANIHVSTNGQTTVFGRSGKALGLDDYFVDAVKQRPFEYVIDGEIVVFDRKKDEYMSRKKSNGIIRKYTQGTIKDEDRERYIPRMFAWDYIPMELFKDHANWEDHRLNAPYSVRLDGVKANIIKGDKIRLLETNMVESYDEIRDIFMQALSEGEEGVVVKNSESRWRSGRPKDHIKMKEVRECELFIKDLQEGKGRFRGKLGAFVCESADGLLEVSVGSGFSEKQREDYFDESLIGRVVTLKFNEVIDHETPNGPEKSLFLPIFVEVRDDKNEANTLDEILKL